MRILKLVAYFIIDEESVVASYKAAESNLASFVASSSK
jgi:hypothetical protein